MSDGQTQDRLLADVEVARRYGVSRSTVWTWAGKDLIPKPVRTPGRKMKWRESEIDQHIRGLEHAELKETA